MGNLWCMCDFYVYGNRLCVVVAHWSSGGVGEDGEVRMV